MIESCLCSGLACINVKTPSTYNEIRMSTHGIRHSEFSLARSLLGFSVALRIFSAWHRAQHLLYSAPLALQPGIRTAQLSPPPFRSLARFPIRLADISPYPQRSGSASKNGTGTQSKPHLARSQLPSSLSLFHARTLSHSASLPISIDPARHPLWHGNDDGTAMASTRLQMWH